MMKSLRTPRAQLPATFEEAEEAQILAVMSRWPHRMEERLKSVGFGNFSEAGHLMWQAKFEHELANPRPDTVATVVWLAEQGHVSAQWALRTYGTSLLEDTKADLSSSVRHYLVLMLNGLIPPQPQDQSDRINNMVRDIGIPVMVDYAADHWKRPRYNSSKRQHSAAWLVALTWTGYDSKLEEQTVRRICKARKTLPQRLAKFLMGGADQSF